MTFIFQIDRFVINYLCNDDMLPLWCQTRLKKSDVHFYTGFPNAETFQTFYEFLQRKARRMHYWKGFRNTNEGLLSPRVLCKELTLSL